MLRIIFQICAASVNFFKEAPKKLNVSIRLQGQSISKTFLWLYYDASP